jgi:DNA-binding response OmpR family regulator
MAKSIVVADDDPDILSIVAMSLETQGYDVYRRSPSSATTIPISSSST